jgi:hypothetical protein
MISGKAARNSGHEAYSGYVEGTEQLRTTPEDIFSGLNRGRALCNKTL